MQTVLNEKAIIKNILTDDFQLFCEKIFNYKLQRFHDEIAFFILGREKALINAPRGFGKSTYFNTFIPFGG
mgnify:FL=1